MDYDSSLSYLKGLERLGIRFRVENTRDLLSAIGFEYGGRVVHIAGTNGKGSCAATLARILREDGRKVGLYTSPELVEFKERIVVDGRQIPKDEFARITGLLKPVIESMKEPPTFFEATTALALKYFADEKVDVMVLEAGMGGRLDSTNVMPSKLSVITNVALDHMQHLGNTVEQIAKEKAGIISAGGTLITAAKGGALDVLAAECEAKGANMARVGYDAWPESVSTSIDGTSFGLRTSRRDYALRSGLRGAFQAKNIACAVLAAEELGASEKSILSGVYKAKWPGRLDVVQRDPTVILDCAHNPDGVARCMEFVKGLEYCRLIVVAGFSKDKDWPKMAKTLSEADMFIATEYANPRSLKAKDILTAVKGEPASTVKEAVSLALSKAKKDDIILVTGSIYVVGEAVVLWDRA
ncbi:MAG: folylpolyglutamate synthase/dihydrofolate synthase family protein [Candidatus Altiarchaeota archaeon]